MALTTKIMEFKDMDSMARFIMLYEDILKPWSEATIVQMDYIPDKKYVKKQNDWHTSITTRGHHDESIAEMARKGYLLMNENMMKIHIELEDFKKIQRNFKKVKIRRNTYKYVLED